jgi:hypothetical protein
MSLERVQSVRGAAGSNDVATVDQVEDTEVVNVETVIYLT